ncbi:MAG: hypothetical protein HQ538_02055, partial [Parcubacteria group bacterium]|nr:hypothetical protein [Parcubacteria group bacterium]
MKLSDEYELLIDCCRASSNAEINNRISSLIDRNSIDWDFIVKESCHHEVICLLYKRLKELGLLSKIPEGTKKALK